MFIPSSLTSALNYSGSYLFCQNEFNPFTPGFFAEKVLFATKALFGHHENAQNAQNCPQNAVQCENSLQKVATSREARFSFNFVSQIYLVFACIYYGIALMHALCWLNLESVVIK